MTKVGLGNKHVNRATASLESALIRVHPRRKVFAFAWKLETELMSLRFQKFLDFQSSHAAGSGGGDGLAIAPVLHVAAGINSRNFRVDIIPGQQIAIFIRLQRP